MDFYAARRPTSRSLWRCLVSLCAPPLRRGVKQAHADYWIKRYGSLDFAFAVLGYFLLSLRSVRELHTCLECNQRLSKLVNLQQISLAQLARLPRDRPAGLWLPLLAALRLRLPGSPLPGGRRALDTSHFRLGMHLMSRCWQRRFSEKSAGFKLWLVIETDTHAPQRAFVTVGQGSDTTHLDRLVPAAEDIQGCLYLFDRGFRKYAFYQDLIDRGADFITRECSAQVHYQVLEVLPPDSAHPEILSDQQVRLGRRESRNLMRSPVRRIELQTPQGSLVFHTSCSEWPAWEVAETYRQRWQIETVFRWIKRTVGCLRPLGCSLEAAEHTLYAALVVYLLVLLLTQGQTHEPGSGVRIALTLRRLRFGLYDPAREADLRAFGFL
jgi:hypothetical protein